jgi:hypothetical protein
MDTIKYTTDTDRFCSRCGKAIKTGQLCYKYGPGYPDLQDLNTPDPVQCLSHVDASGKPSSARHTAVQA